MAPTRDEALDRLAAALDETVVAGPRSNAGFLAALCRAAGVPRRATSTPASSTAIWHALGAAPQGLDRAAAAARRARS